MNARLGGRRIPGNDGIPLALEPGDDFGGVLRLYPAAIVSGRIIGASGRPAVGLEVTPFRWAYNGLGEREPVFLESQATNDLGEFRFNALDPGEYGFRVQGSETGLAEPTSALFRPFYYPGTEQRDQAGLVVSESAIETRLRDFFVPSEQPQGRLRIHPVDAIGDPVSGPSTVSIFASAEHGAIRSGTVVPGSSETTGSLPYGSYDIVVTSIVDRAMASGRTTIDLQSAETDVEITVAPMRSLTGRATSAAPDGGPPRPVTGVLLRFLDTTAFQRFGRDLDISLTSDADGTVRSDAFAQGAAYHVRVVDVPADMYLASITYRGEAVLGDAFYVDPREEVELVISLEPGAATVRGSVVGNDGASMPLAVVALLPDDRSRTHMFMVGNADLQGQYRIENVAPGAYRLYAWPELDGAAYRNADFMSAFDGQGTPVLIEIPEPVTVDLTALAP